MGKKGETVLPTIDRREYRTRGITMPSGTPCVCYAVKRAGDGDYIGEKDGKEVRLTGRSLFVGGVKVWAGPADSPEGSLALFARFPGLVRSHVYEVEA